MPGVVGLRSHTSLSCLQPSAFVCSVLFNSPFAFSLMLRSSRRRKEFRTLHQWFYCHGWANAASVSNERCYFCISMTQDFVDDSCWRLINAWNEARCKGRQKTTASFVLVAQGVQLIYGNFNRSWTCCLHFDLYGWQITLTLMALKKIGCCAKILIFVVKWKMYNSLVVETDVCACKWVLWRNSSFCSLEIVSSSFPQSYNDFLTCHDTSKGVPTGPGLLKSHWHLNWPVKLLDCPWTQ